jgi:hypothetical protein
MGKYEGGIGGLFVASVMEYNSDGMITDATSLFESLLKTTEVKKIDFKESQYRLDNNVLKSDFVKDILCMANAPGDDGYIILGVKSDKGQPREVVGISHHHDSSDLEAIVNGVTDPPIQFEYHPLNYQGAECALFHIPKSKAKPHWPKRDYGKLERHIIYTRRSSGNREASIQEIREICIETMQLSDIAQRKIRTSHHVVDELKDMSLDERKAAMYKMLKTVAKKVDLVKYQSIMVVSPYHPGQVCALASSISEKSAHLYTILMYPWSVKLDDINGARSKIRRVISGSTKTNLRASLRASLEESILVHIAYKDIYTKALESRYDIYLYNLSSFANAWKEPWGRIIKWEADIPEVHEEIIRGKKQWRTSYQKKARYEFFVPNVTSKAELQDRLEKLLAWVDSNIT